MGESGAQADAPARVLLGDAHGLWPLPTAAPQGTDSCSSLGTRVRLTQVSFQISAQTAWALTINMVMDFSLCVF